MQIIPKPKEPFFGSGLRPFIVLMVVVFVVAWFRRQFNG